jgi:UDP-N-acetylmuramyl pentapeptide phosphotransferase/UDP-N-acetylglucosamine-1-phosphate transferase
MNIDFINNELNILIILILIFFTFNFFGRNFLGDGAAYGIGFLLGYILVKISLIDQSISPYYIANLFWYPAFENLFSILRRTFKSINNYLPDNYHLHHLIYKYLKKKDYIKKKFLISSLVGLIINFVLIINYSIGYIYLTNTVVQSVLIISGVFLYLVVYYSLIKKIN